MGLKKIVPRSLVELIARFDVAPLPVKYFVADMPTTVPFSVSVKAPSVNVLLAPVKVSEPFTVGLLVNVKALVEAAFNSRLPTVTPAMVAPTPVMVILPDPVLICVPVPEMFP